jgi:hypothetical protein
MQSNESRDEEKIIAKLKPHPLAFADKTVLWIYTIIVSLLVYYERGAIQGKISSIPLIGGKLSGVASGWGLIGIIALSVLIPVLFYSLFKVTWRPLAVAFIVVALLPAVVLYLGYAPIYALGLIIAASIFEIIRIDLQRRKYQYTLTTRRVITEYKGLAKSSRRDVLYSKLSDVIMEKGLLGRIFGFGNIYLVSNASMGMGEDIGAITVGGGVSAGPVSGGGAVTGGRTVSVPRSRPQYILYAVPKPEKTANIIMEAQKEGEEAPYLKKILEKLDNN